MRFTSSRIGTVEVWIDVGERKEFMCTLEDVIHCSPLWSSEKSAIVKVIQMDGNTYLVCFKWSKVKWEVSNKPYIYLSAAEEITLAPQYHDISMYKSDETFVSVVARSYIRGEPASTAWHGMSSVERKRLIADVSSAVTTIATKTSRRFGSIRYYNLATENAHVFLNYKILLSKLSNELNGEDIALSSEDSFPSTPSLCHGNLILDHIIVHNGKLAGIVGWSKCEFLPEVLDRVMYYFMAGTSTESQWWFSSMAEVPLSYAAVPPMFLVSCVYYYYHIALKKSSAYDVWRVEQTLSQLMNQAFDAAVELTEQDGDTVSLDSHTTSLFGVGPNPFSDTEETRTVLSCGETVDTWEVFDDTESSIIELLSRASAV